MKGTLVLISVSSRNTPSVRHREHAEKGLDLAGSWERQTPRILVDTRGRIDLNLVVMLGFN